MKNKINKITYLVIVACVIIMNFFSYDVIQMSKKYFEEMKEDYAESVIDYIKELLDVEKNNAKNILNCFDNGTNYTKKEIEENINILNDDLVNFNVNFPNYLDTYIVLENGSYLRASGNQSQYFDNLDFSFNEDFEKYYNSCSFETLSYQELDEENVYIYQGPFFDKNRQLSGLVLRTMNLEALANKISLIDKTYFKLNIVITDENDTTILYVNNNGVKNKENDSQLEYNAENYITNATVTYFDSERKLKFYVYVENTQAYNIYVATTSTITIIIIFIFTIMIINYLRKKYKIKRDKLIACIILFLAIMFYSIAFDYTYRIDLNNLYSLQSYFISNLTELEMQDVLFESIKNEIYEIISANNDMLEKDIYLNLNNEFKKNINAEFVKYLYSEEVYLIGKEYTYDLYNKNIIENNEFKKYIYNENISNNGEYYEFIYEISSPADSKIIKTYRIGNYDYVLALSIDSSVIQDKMYNKFASLKNVDGIYSAEIVNGSLKIQKIRKSNEDVAFAFDKYNFVKITSDTLQSDIEKFLESEEKYNIVYSFNYENVAKPVFLTKTSNLKIVNLFFYDVNEIYIIRRKMMENMIGIIFVYIILFIFNKQIVNYLENKTEKVQLHGNY